MKISLVLNAAGLIMTAIICTLLFSACKTNTTTKGCCEGFTGKPSNPRAEKLVNTCHFIEVDSIVVWTARYQEYKKRTPSTNDAQGAASGTPSTTDLLLDSSSFNGCIVRKILSNENSIGLRVVHGMSADRRIHVILVGIKPDYSTLYISEPAECCGIRPQQQNLTGAPGTGKLGGAEYGQLP